MSIHIDFVYECDKCGEETENDNWICDSCIEKNRCDICGIKGAFNFERFDYGIRCKGHKQNGMVNLHTKEQAAKRFKKHIEERLGGKMIGEYKNSSTRVKCICANDHPCEPFPESIQERNV